MSVAEQITRIQADRNTIRNKLIALGMATSTDNLDKLATAIDGIADQGAVSAEILEGTTYTIPKGYHNGSGTVKALTDTAGEAEKYKTQTKTVTPTKQQQSITPNSGYYALESVTVNPIPDAYQDVSSVTAGAGDVLAGKVIVDATGAIKTGTMANNGAVAKTLTTSDSSYTVPAGYHSGSGKVSVTPEDKSVTPTKAAQDVTATTGKVLNKVSVAAIPDAYQDVTAVTAGAANVLTGKTFVAADGTVVDGTMVNNGAVTKVLDTSTTSYTVPAGYHNGSGKVSLTVETKTATPSKATQTVSPSSGKVLSKVTVNPIPDAYQDVTGVTATADKVLTGSSFVDADGTEVAGTMANNGAVSQVLDTETESYTVPAGYHDGTGEVTINTQGSVVTPKKTIVVVNPDSGYVFSSVAVNPIPDEYQDVTGVTATADKVLEGSTFVDSTGAEVAGTMANNSAVTKVLDTATTSYTIPAGYHSGSGKVIISVEDRAVTPTKEKQICAATSGKLIRSFIVRPIPDAYQDVTAVDAEAAHVLDGKKIVDATGTVVTGSMANNGDVSATIDGLTTTSVTIPAGYTTGGTVSLTDDIEEALAAI